jgi:protein-S-isoprenylcysteine O-methyltransferase Ste14
MRLLELKIPPLLLFLLFAGAMWLLAEWLPEAALPLPWRLQLAAVLTVAGAAVAMGGVVAFRRASTTVNPVRPDAASAMVTTGVYQYTRNPMYLGLVIILAAWALVLANLVAWLLVPLFAAWLDRFQVVPEERAMAARFGQRFEDYRRRVRRWI